MARGRTTHNLQMPMKIQITLILTLTLAGLALTARGSDDSEQAEFPQITAQPTDQGACEGEPASFSVKASHRSSEVKYQWRRNGTLMEGQTNENLTLETVTVDDAGLYSCDVAAADGEAVPTRSASLSVMALIGDQICVFGLPKASYGAMGNCPGYYAGYVNYTKTIAQGWGWAPATNTTTVFTASDGGGRTDTKIMYGGKFGDTGCGVTTVTIPNVPPSPKYRFTVYFQNPVPTTNYPIILNGFLP
jgi:hypothetical protein